MTDQPRVVIGMDPHKRSITIEVKTADEQVVVGGRFEPTTEGFDAMLAHVAPWPDRVWAIEGCGGFGRHVAARLTAIGEPVVKVPAKCLGLVARQPRCWAPCSSLVGPLTLGSQARSDARLLKYQLMRVVDDDRGQEEVAWQIRGEGTHRPQL